MEHVKVASKFVVQYARLIEIDRGGRPRYSESKVLAVAGSLAGARELAAAAVLPSDDAQILEVFDPIVVPGAYVKFLDPKVHPVVEPKAPRKPRKVRKAA
jgi:hypothetical protein